MLESLPEAPQPCVFCNLPPENTLLHQTDAFYVIADYAPLTPGHLLLIPKQHVPCLAELPPGYDAEFESVKSLIAQFALETYGRLTFWENGIVGQSVPHGHLHALPWSPDPARLANAGTPIDGLPGLRRLFSEDRAPYFYVEQAGVAQKLIDSLDHARPVLLSGEPLLRYGNSGDEKRIMFRAEVQETARHWRAFQAATKP